MHFRNGEKEKQFSQHTRTLAPASCCFRGQALRVRPLLLGGRAAERGLRGGRAAVDLRARRVQRLHLRVWPDGQRKDAHDAGSAACWTGGRRAGCASLGQAAKRGALPRCHIQEIFEKNV